MTQMVRWDPLGEFQGLRRAMDRLFEDFAPSRSLRGGTEGAELTFPVDISENENEVTVKAVLPGIKPEDVDITISEGVLTIRGQTRSEQSEEKENYYRREIRYGSFARSVPLPARVNQDNADAEFKDGMLSIRLPKAEESRPKSIRIKGAAQTTEASGNGQRAEVTSGTPNA
jgi:HSP20 family protein